MTMMQSYFASTFLLAISCALVLLVVASCDLQPAHSYAAAMTAYQVLP